MVIAKAGITGICNLASLKGIFLVLDKSFIRGITTVFPLNLPPIIVA
jgi:hypothetical protein